jgi:hypothetical protein
MAQPVPLSRLLGDHRLRASDAEREWVIDRLRVHAGAGRLTPDELEDRIDLAYASRTRGELARLLGDLPERLPPAGRLPAAHAARPPRRLRLRRWLPVAVVLAVVAAAGGPWDRPAEATGADAAVAAALRATGGPGRVLDVDRRWGGWEVEVERDGLVQEVRVDEDGSVVEVESED